MSDEIEIDFLRDEPIEDLDTPTLTFNVKLGPDEYATFTAEWISLPQRLIISSEVAGVITIRPAP